MEMSEVVCCCILLNLLHCTKLCHVIYPNLISFMMSRPSIYNTDVVSSTLFNFPVDSCKLSFHSSCIAWETKPLSFSREDNAHGYVLWCHRRNCAASKTASLSRGKRFLPLSSFHVLMFSYYRSSEECIYAIWTLRYIYIYL